MSTFRMHKYNETGRMFEETLYIAKRNYEDMVKLIPCIQPDPCMREDLLTMAELADDYEMKLKNQSTQDEKLAQEAADIRRGLRYAAAQIRQCYQKLDEDERQKKTAALLPKKEEQDEAQITPEIQSLRSELHTLDKKWFMYQQHVKECKARGERFKNCYAALNERSEHLGYDLHMFRQRYLHNEQNRGSDLPPFRQQPPSNIIPATEDSNADKSTSGRFAPYEIQARPAFKLSSSLPFASRSLRQMTGALGTSFLPIPRSEEP